jgi:hypothetical protein
MLKYVFILHFFLKTYTNKVKTIYFYVILEMIQIPQKRPNIFLDFFIILYFN